MELGLSLGADAKKPFDFLSKFAPAGDKADVSGLGFCMAIGIDSDGRQAEDRSRNDVDFDESAKQTAGGCRGNRTSGIPSDDHPPVQLDLLPLVPVPRVTPILHWSSDNGSSEGGSSGKGFDFDVNRPPTAAVADEASSPKSVASSFQMDFSLFGEGASAYGMGKRDSAAGDGAAGCEAERASSRASDDDENALNSRKKLRLTKEQSAFLEESFKEHNTLNPKQKLTLAKQLNLRPRQVEVWFQNRRARTKLKQTEVDCEHLKRCYETLTEENRRLHKELQELRALKSSNPFYMQSPATTLTMCPSCERVGPTAAVGGVPPTTTASEPSTPNKPIAFPPQRPRFFPFSNKPTSQPHQSATS